MSVLAAKKDAYRNCNGRDKEEQMLREESADIILLDDNFGTIVNAIREGRKVYDNMKKSIKFHLSANFGELLLVLTALLISLPLPIASSRDFVDEFSYRRTSSVALSVEKEKDIMKEDQ